MLVTTYKVVQQSAVELAAPAYDASSCAPSKLHRRGRVCGK